MDLLEAIASVGFPIVAYLLIYMDLRKVVQRNNEILNHLTELIEEVKK